MKIGEVNYQVYYNSEIIERKSINIDKGTSNQGIRNQKDVFEYTHSGGGQRLS